MATKQKSPPPLTESSTDRPSKIPRMSTSLVLGKICIVCYGAPAEDLGCEFSYGLDGCNTDHCLFLIDLDSSSSETCMNRNPNLCFDSCSLGVDGFCVLGSTLYLFEDERNGVFSYDLSSIPILPSSPPPEEVITLNVDMLGDAPPMHHRKYWPQGCQTPDGQKMLVFSALFFHLRPKGNFELFCQGKWEVLPDLHSLLPRSWDHNADGVTPGVFSYSPDYVYVVSYAFVGSKRQRLLITTSVGSFELDIDRPENGWSVSDKYRFRHTDVLNFMLVKGDLCFMEWFGWVDRAGARRKLPYKGLSMDDDSFYTRIGRGLSWLSSNRFCVARGCVDIASMQPHLIIDVWDLDSENNHVEADEMPGMNLEKRFEFVAGRQSRFNFCTKLLSFIP